MATDASTTARQRSAASASYDLATGYPKGFAFDDIVRATRHVVDHDTSDAETTDRRLQEAVHAMLAVKREPDRTWATFSASVAIQRALASLDPGIVILVEPLLDIVPAMVQELQGLEVAFFDTSGDAATVEQSLLSEIESTPNLSAVFVTLPANPGWGAPSGAIEAIAAATTDRGATLILDESFALFTERGHSLSWADIYSSRHNTISLWDSGKTFDVDHAKLGFLFATSSQADRLSRSMDVIQLQTSQRDRLFFAHLFRQVVAQERQHEPLDRIRRRQTQAEAWLAPIGVRTRRSGSVLTLDLADSELSAVELSHSLQSSGGVAVTACDTFSTNPRIGARYLRISLARSKTYLDAALAVTVDHIQASIGPEPRER